jgi:hypothetical protein
MLPVKEPPLMVEALSGEGPKLGSIQRGHEQSRKSVAEENGLITAS